MDHCHLGSGGGEAIYLNASQRAEPINLRNTKLILFAISSSNAYHLFLTYSKRFPEMTRILNFSNCESKFTFLSAGTQYGIS